MNLLVFIFLMKVKADIRNPLTLLAHNLIFHGILKQASPSLMRLKSIQILYHFFNLYNKKDVETLNSHQVKFLLSKLMSSGT